MSTDPGPHTDSTQVLLPGCEYFPPLHVEQDLEPEEEKVLTGQRGQAEAPASELKRPGVQSVQVDEPMEEVRPDGQLTQTLLRV